MSSKSKSSTQAGIEPNFRRGMCATAVLPAQEDFKSTRSRLQEIFEDAGHIFILYPKFHCELNWRGYYWDAVGSLHASIAIILYQVSNLGPHLDTALTDRPVATC